MSLQKLIMCDFTEYHSPSARLANYHYCNCFVKAGYEALWVSNAFNELIYLKDKEDYRFKKGISSPSRHQLSENIYGFAPYSLMLYGNYPLFRNSKVLTRFEKYIRPDIKYTLRKIDFLDTDVLWISNPKAYWMTNVVKYNKLVYRIADDYRQFPEFPHISSIDDLLIEKADTIVVSSKTLENRITRQGKNPIYISNGVEFEHFDKKADECPPDYESAYGKRIVYVGAIKYWFDTELIRKLAEQVEADIYLIGKPETDLSTIDKHDNVHILGPRSYEVIPAYLQYADVALIPFVKSDLTDSISPIKLFEYCSAGTAVVTTNMRETMNLNAPIWVADNHDSFIRGVKHYLEEGYDSSELNEYGRKNSWDSRFQSVMQNL